MFSADLYTPNFDPVDTQRLRLTPISYSAQAMGGPVEARVQLDGDELTCWSALEWLRYYVVIRNSNGTPVWSGLVTGIEVQTPATRIGITLDDMRNRINVDYTYDDVDGVPQSAETGWLGDDVSIARYGIREERVSLADAPQTQAEQKRATWLEQVRLPIGSVEPSEGQTSAILNCRGLWQTLDWQYYTNDVGRIVYEESDNAEHLLGWGLTSTTIGFRNKAIHDIGARLDNLVYGGKVVVSGSASNNTTLTVGQPGSDEQVVRTATTISFDANDDVFDSGGGLGQFNSDAMIRVEGSSAHNNGYYWVKTTGTVAIEISGGANIIQGAAAGPSITLTQGHAATVEEAVTTERPGANTTLTALGVKIAQSFSLSGSTSWPAYEVMVRAKKIGTPADSLRVSLWLGASEPTAQLAWVNVSAAEISQDMNWVKATFGSPPTLSPGYTYWIVVERSGSNAHDNCYVVGVSTETLYAGGAMKIWNGSAWATRWEDGDLPFQIWSQSETSSQMLNMLQSEGQFFSAVSIMDASGVWKRQYRDGTRRALAEVEEMMESGSSSSRRYIATVTPERACIVRLEPSALDDAPQPIYSAATGEFRQAQGGAWEEGLLPCGLWVAVGDVPPLVGLTTASLSPFFCERADYNVENGRITPEPRGRKLPWDV